MSSLNGDMFVMRNGRSTSEISVYNYPEHLNPFYEDDQHKRLRFWHINKKGDSGSRRNSFSISNLKDIWAFKSFRLKKKSSTLGVNKTSESPPPLRRDIYYGASPTDNGHNFPRNALYRSSLQNMNTPKDNSNELGFYRNNRYRQTIQNVGVTTSSPSQQVLTPHRRYVYGGSVTPQPLRSSDYNKGDENQGITRGSSQLSVSTNPFDSDNEDADNDNEAVSISGRHSTHAKMQRKKRKAPAPPVPVHRINQNNELKQSNQTELHIDERLHIEEDMDIANITAEIESLVKSTNEEPIERGTKINQPTILKENGIEPGKQRIEMESVSKVESTERLSEKIPQAVPRVTKKTKPIETNEHDEDSQNNSSASGKHEVIIKDTTKEIPQKVSRNNETIDKCHKQESHLHNRSPPPVYVQEPETGHIECIHVHIDNPKALRDRDETNTLSSFHTSQKNVKESVTEKSAFTLTNPPKVKQIDVKAATGAKSSVVTSSITPPNSNTNNLESVEETTNITTTHTIVKPPIATKPITDTKNKSITSVEVHKSKNTALTVDPKRNVVSTNKTESILLEETDSSNAQMTKGTTEGVKIEQTASEPLKIVEPAQNDLESESSATSSNNIVNGSSAINKIDLYADIYREPSSRFGWKNSTLAPLEPNVPPEKRKSVKEIIESINKSQRLLNAAAHREQTYSLTGTSELPTVSTADTWKYAESNNFNQNKQKLDVDESEVQHVNTNGKSFETVTSTTNAANFKEDSQKLDNNEIFKKCRVDKEVYDCRESSPTASNLDWNPVPKPKRTKNLSDV